MGRTGILNRDTGKQWEADFSQSILFLGNFLFDTALAAYDEPRELPSTTQQHLGNLIGRSHVNDRQDPGPL
jgi:hypothetical protein